MGLMAGKVVVVTGSASGNGRAIVQRFAEEDARAVVIADIRREPREGGPTTEDLVRQTNKTTEPVFVLCDVTEDDDLGRVVEAGRALGGIDVLVNNAGVYWRRPVAEENRASFDRMIGVTLRGPFLLSQAIAPMMAARGGGAIINVGSVAGIAGTSGFALYCAAKAALHSLTLTFAAEFGPAGVRVNTVAPGRIRTAMTTRDVPTIDEATGRSDVSRIPLGRYGEPVDVANACLFLASDLAAFVSAETLIVDGGTRNTGFQLYAPARAAQD
jgi:NAD(P)-dependent dehydrogenase (short-subunit alcohol dehydrogenase family)